MAALTHDQVTAIQSRFEGPVLAMAGVTGVDVGLLDPQRGPEAGYVIRVYVESLAAAPALPASVEGVAVRVVERRFGLQR